MIWEPVEEEGPNHACQAAQERSLSMVHPSLRHLMKFAGPAHHLRKEQITDEATLVSCVACNKVWWEFKEDED